MKKRLSFFISSLLFAPLSFAEPAPTADAAATNSDIPALIKQLGDDDPKIRDQASEKLRKIGPDALPALTEARKSEDPEVVNRAQTVSKQIDEDLHPKPRVNAGNPNSTIFLGNRGQRVIVGGLAGGGAGNVQLRITSTVNNGTSKSVSITRNNGVTVKETTVKEGDKTTKIHEDADGIAVTITQMKDGKEVSETTKAKDKDALKKDNPEIFKIYEKHSQDDVQINGAGGNIRVQNNAGLIQRQAEMEKRMLEAQQRAQEQMKQLEERVQEAQQRAQEQLKQIEKDAQEIIKQAEKQGEEQKK